MAKTKDIRVLCNCEWRHNLSVLPLEIRAKIYDAIFEYAETGEATGLDVMEKAIFEPIRKEVERYMENYRDICEVRRKKALEREEHKRAQKSTKEHTCGQECTSDHKTPHDPTNPNPNPNPNASNEASIEKSTTSSSNANAPDVVDVRRGQKDLAREIASYYNEQVEAKGARLRKCERVNKEREGWILARIDEFGEEKVKLGIDKAIASRGLNYDMNIAPVDISWIMRPRNFAEILEGKYDNKQHSKAPIPFDPGHFDGEGDEHAYDDEEKNWK